MFMNRNMSITCGAHRTNGNKCITHCFYMMVRFIAYNFFPMVSSRDSGKYNFKSRSINVAVIPG